ncbi:hypothetical protein JCM5353_008069 [Sporobolomyces roseus]
MPHLFHRLARSLLRMFKRKGEEEEEEPEDNRWKIIEHELRKKLRPVNVIRGYSDSESLQSTRVLLSESCRPACRLSLASALSILQLEEETSHVLRLRTLNTSRVPAIIRPDDDDD